MTNDKGILIKNIYYMLTYAFKELKQNNYEQIAGEDFENTHELFAEILSKGIAYILKQGLHKEYITINETNPTLRGKLDIQGTIKEKLAQHLMLTCEHDLLSENNLFNQIIKAAVTLLINHSNVSKERKHTLKRMMLFFNSVDNISLSDIKWNMLKYDRNSRSYQMLHGLCYFLLNNKLLTTDDGKTKMAQFSDEHMNLLFQRFILEYYKYHHSDYKAYSKQINWDLESFDSSSANMLPIMQTDTTLTLGDRTLIIDAKYYGKTLQENFGKLSIHSSNMYQIHAYVTNEDISHKGNVDGLLLYAATSDEWQPNYIGKNHYGNVFMAKSINLNKDFNDIKQQLEDLTKYKTE